jgi:hypothetical protein
MRDLAPPVSRGEFYYNGRGIFVVIEGINYHREDPRRLHTLLTHVRGQPLLTKAGVVSKRKPPKSKPVEFYIAQLMHYGLKIYKTKDVAKKHLLQSFNLATGTIAIPQNIQKLEKEMKKEWDKNNESANKKADEELEKRRKAAADRIAALEVKPTAKSAANLAATQSLKADAPRSASKKKTNTAADRKLIEKIIQLSQEPLKKLLLDLLIQAPDAGKTLEELMKQHTVANDPKKAPSNSLVSHPTLYSSLLPYENLGPAANCKEDRDDCKEDWYPGGSTFVPLIPLSHIQQTQQQQQAQKTTSSKKPVSCFRSDCFGSRLMLSL